MAQGVSFSTDASMVPGAAIGEASQLNNITSTDNSPSCPCCPIIFIVSLFGFFGIIPGFIIVCFFVMRIANPRIYSAEANRQVVLKNIRGSKSTSFKWVKSASFRGTALLDGNDVVATLVWPIPLISTVIGTTAEGEWVFEEGMTITFFKPPSLSVYKKSTKEIAAFIKQDWHFTGNLKIGEKVYQWVRIDRIGNKWEFRTEDGKPLIRFTLKSDGTNTRPLYFMYGDVETLLPAHEIEDISLLVLTGYRMIRIFHTNRIRRSRPSINMS